MTTITLDSRECSTVLVALRVLRIALTGHRDALDLTREQA